MAEKTIKCKKCGKPLDANHHSFASYCEEYLNKLRDASAQGAIFLSRLEHTAYWIIHQEDNTTDNQIKETSMYGDVTQVDVIVKGRKLAKKHNLPLIFDYQKHGTVWFLDEYLDTHPKIKQAVEDLEEKQRNSIIGKIKTKLSKDKPEVV